MSPFAGLDQRQRVPEVMDQPSLEEARHTRALRGLERINRWSGSVRILWPAIRAYAAERNLKSLSMLDIGTGAGDIPIGLWHKARKIGLGLRIEGWDISERAVAHARRNARARQAEMLFFRRDILDESILLHYDIIVCSLFLHHLDDKHAVELLQAMGNSAQGMILVNDLRRSTAGLALAYAGSRLLSTSDVVHTDALLSVRAAFTPEEVMDLAHAAGLEGATVERRWPMRYLLTWKRRPTGEMK